LSSKEVLMRQLTEEVVSCRKCSLWQSRRNPVVGEGNLNSMIMFIGEAPGYHEDIQGRPFVGAAGKLLTELLHSIGLSREDVYITNVLKCRPPNNRDPRPEEIKACSPYLDRQLLIIKPSIVVTLGRHATSYILSRAGLAPRNISSVRGKIFRLNVLGLSITLLPTYHPAAALYRPPLRTKLEEDFNKLKSLMHERGRRSVSLEDFLKS